MNKTIIALKIIEKNEIHMPKEFARLMWPNSDAWRRVQNVGHGATAGAGIVYSAGGFLGKLRNQGLIAGGYGYHYFLTEKGKELLIVQKSQNEK
jgi:hypothetical protein